MDIPVVVQHRHVHLSEVDWQTLFGEELPMSVRELEHRGQYVSEHCLKIIGETGTFDCVRVLGPYRSSTQVELSASDAFAIGIDAPVRISGDLVRAGTCELKGTVGTVKAVASTIIPARHLHCSTKSADQLKVAHLDVVSLRIVQTGQIIQNVVVRVHPTFATAFHPSKDEAAEWWLQTGDHVTIV
ncbi:phosphate propanoyltransferase [Candidatus Uhrbacteria bacterium CG_4_9_14_3_um_filter_50_9]|uniref:Phosphate propanoyltransferase n=1 Tax=Candidatus Uhrbacteria bacterium CG_4_9_14_3_um_filter_50_9 TaxID=1975035 RepID=A0A2M7XDP7_9BACT|nr:MAG: phosphate propanoyltransferase [Candidatus Uhrbacteria bacterium CG_4_9_14_3_um_filter_50_9]